VTHGIIAFLADNRLLDVRLMLGFVLGPLAEAQLRGGLSSSHEGLFSLVMRPFSLLFLSLAIAALATI
jgi:TctA family transporter